LIVNPKTWHIASRRQDLHTNKNLPFSCLGAITLIEAKTNVISVYISCLKIKNCTIVASHLEALMTMFLIYYGNI